MHRSALLFFCLITLSLPPIKDAVAAFVLDDFTDPIRIDVPAQNLVFVESSNVGDLNVTRNLRVSGLRPIPVGFLDVDQSQSSALVANFPTLLQNPPDPVLGINLNYALAPIGSGIDLTESGRNNAVILDFDRLTAVVPLYRLLVSVTHGPTVIRYSSSLIPIPQSPVPFRLFFPFDEFSPDRGGPIGDVVFSEAGRVDFLLELALTNPVLPEELDFQMVLKDIRFGRIPEPTAFVFTMMLTSILVGGRPISLRSNCHAHLRASSDCAFDRDLKCQPSSSNFGHLE